MTAEVLKSKGVTLEQARIEVEKIIGRGSDSVVPNFPFTPKLDHAFNLAIEEAERLGRNCINTDHLLLGILRIEDGTAIQVLITLGLDAIEIRDLITWRLGENTQE